MRPTEENRPIHHFLSGAFVFRDGTATTFCHPISFFAKSTYRGRTQIINRAKAQLPPSNCEDLQFEKMIPKPSNFSLKKKTNTK
jgi:hypothetical protein